MAESASDSRLVLRRAFMILSAFKADQEVRTLAEITREVGLPKSTVHRLAQQLVDEGALERSAGGYRLGLQMFEIGSRIGPQRRLREVAAPFMQDLYEATHETVQLGVLDDLEVVYLAKIEGHRAVKLPTWIGCRMPTYCTALGKVLLAFSEPDVVSRVIDAGMTNRTPYTITNPRVLAQQLADIARAGVAYDREESVVGAACAAAPIFDWRGRSIGALSVSGPMVRFDPMQISQRLRRAADSVTRIMRGRPPQDVEWLQGPARTG